MSDGPGSMPYIPAITGRDSGEGGTAFVIGIIAVVGGVALAMRLQKILSRRPATTFRRRPLPAVKHSKEQKKFIDTHVEVTEGVSGTSGLPTGLRLTVEFAQHDKSYTATVINVSDESFVVTLPPVKAGSVPFNPAIGDEARFFAVREGRNFTFSTKVLQVFSGGLRACSFRHTSDIVVGNRRGQTRVFGDAPVLFTAIPQNMITGSAIPVADLARAMPCEIPGLMQDISTGGCALRTRSPLRFGAGDLVLLNACLPGSEDEFALLAGITGEHSLAGEGGGSLLNLEFLALETQTLAKIGEYVSTQLEDRIID